jgi:hypothetical protein
VTGRLKKSELTVLAPLILAAIAVGVAVNSWRSGLVASVAAFFLTFLIAPSLHRVILRRKGGPKRHARDRIGRFLTTHADWHLRIYRTPAGLRVLALHRIFAPDESAVTEFFEALGTDPVYRRMCRNQHCFRALLSPKPWRIGIADHMKPRPGLWPVNPERIPGRNLWIQKYEKAAEHYAACTFIEALGATTMAPEARAVQKLHDELSRAESNLPIA